MFYVYILLSKKDNNLYIGSTFNLKQRIFQHHNGLVDSTKNRLPVKIIYYEGFISKTDCLREELFLKSGKGRGRLKELLKNSR
jgi:putative endonuclease